jgi:hypothetical protein
MFTLGINYQKILQYSFDFFFIKTEKKNKLNYHLVTVKQMSKIC